MTLLPRRWPIPHDTDRAALARADWTGEGGAVADLIAGAAGSSPHLAALLRTEGAWLAGALGDPDDALVGALAGALAVPDLPPAALGPSLRQAKRRVALLAAVMDLGGLWPLERVTGALTDLADRAVDAGLRALIADATARGRMPPTDAPAGGVVAFAMGKMGAHELNYSSDIDLIALLDEDAHPADALPDARAAAIRAVKALAQMLSDRTADGYVFRTDLRLRPDAAVTPVVLTMSAAEGYYESLGRTWERAAWIKARPCGGDLAAGEAFQRTLRPFVWRKHLDFAAIQDAHDMRLRIRDHKGLGGPFRLDGHDLKLGRGGIREIEFFTQTRQLIAGGRDPSLRVRGTVEGLARLADAGWVPGDVAATLTDHYRRLREIEHRVQMVADQQTHALPETREAWAQLAALTGEEEAALRADLTARMEEVHELTEGFFAPDAAPPPTDDWGAEVTSRWPSYAALRSPRAVATFRRLRPEILRRLLEAPKPDEALLAFDGFLSALPAGVQLFALFEANPDLLRLLVEIASASPALGRYLSRNAGVLDAVIGGRFFAPFPDAATLDALIDAALAETSDYEAMLGAARRWCHEWWFRTGVHHLQGLTGADEAAKEYAAIAGAVLRGVFPRVEAEFARKHGRVAGRGAAVLGMGSLGAERLNAGSDLDLIVLYDAEAESSDGPRPLATRAYYARLTQALVTALTAPMADGRLYEVDMRLRPSGRQGPVAVSFAGFRDYQRDEAWTWEHLALTRARVVAGEPSLAAEIEAERRVVVARRAGDAAVRADTAAMRARLAQAKAAEPWSAKDGAGRLRDCDLAAEALALMAGSSARAPAAQVQAGLRAGLVTEADAAAILDSHRLFSRVQGTARLLADGPLDPATLGEAGVRVLLREAGEPDLDALAQRMVAAAAAADAAIGRVLS